MPTERKSIYSLTRNYKRCQMSEPDFSRMNIANTVEHAFSILIRYDDS